MYEEEPKSVKSVEKKRKSLLKRRDIEFAIRGTLRCNTGGIGDGYDKESFGDGFVHECLGEVRQMV
jgi:hypothetical protein